MVDLNYRSNINMSQMKLVPYQNISLQSSLQKFHSSQNISTTYLLPKTFIKIKRYLFMCVIFCSDLSFNYCKNI